MSAIVTLRSGMLSRLQCRDGTTDPAFSAQSIASRTCCGVQAGGLDT